MAGSVTLVIRAHKKRQDGTCPVYLRVTKDRKSRYIASGVNIAPSDWNEGKQLVRAGHRIADSHNAHLRRLKSDAQIALNSGKSAIDIKVSIVGDGSELGEYLQAFINDRVARDQFWEARKYAVLLGKLNRCFPEGQRWIELDVEAVKRFQTFLVSECKNSPSTTHKELSRLKRVLSEAVRDGVIEVTANPFVRFRMPKPGKVDRRKLSMEQIEALRSVDLVGRDAISRDVFLFAFYAGGMRFGDVCLLKVGSLSDGYVRYTAMKTGEPMSMPVAPAGIEIARRYAGEKDADQWLFPLLDGKRVGSSVEVRRSISSANASSNTGLKRVATAAGLEPKGLSMHIARHSFADLLRSQGGSIHSIMQALGHQHMQVTQKYLKSLDGEAKDTLVKDVWANVSGL